MPQLFRRRPEVVSAVQYHGDPVRGVEQRRFFRKGKKEYRGAFPMVDTVSGPAVPFLGDWIVEFGDGTRALYTDDLFRLAYEPL